VLRSSSILWRIVFLHAIAIVITAIFLPLALYWLLASDVKGLQRSNMQDQVSALARHLTLQRDNKVSLDLSANLRALYSEAYGRYVFAILDETGHVLYSSRRDQAPVFPTDDRSSPIEFFEMPFGERIFSGVSVRKEIDGRMLWIQVAEDLAHRDVIIDDVVAYFFQRVAWITLPILLLLLVIDIVIFRRAVQPLLRASDRAEHISPTQIDVRLTTDDMPAEIRPLVIAVNRALDRLETGFARLREFTADAAHELRTPLTVLRARIETLPDRHVAKALQRDVEDMSRAVSQLLDAAELETFIVDAHERADLRAACLDVAEFIAPLALLQAKTIALSGCEDPVWINGNAEMLSRAVRNLTENALKHAPQGTHVEIVVGREGTVTVLDEGEGVPADKRELIFQRFWRRDRRQPGGAGLGLSIVKRIVELHGGTVTVENRAVRGASFSMRFPLAEETREAASAQQSK
jgi:signal transduction histidine kinase